MGVSVPPPQAKGLWAHLAVSSVHSAPSRCHAGSQRKGGGMGGRGSSPWQAPGHPSPLPSQLGGPCMCLISSPWRGAHKRRRAQVPTPRPAFLWSSEGVAGREGRVSHPLRNTKFCPNSCLSFNIPRLMTSGLSTLVGLPGSRDALPSHTEIPEGPGAVPTLPGAPARPCPRDPGSPAWPLAGCELVRRLFPPGLQSPVQKMKGLGRTVSEVVPSTPCSLLGTVQKPSQWPEESCMLHAPQPRN